MEERILASFIRSRAHPAIAGLCNSLSRIGEVEYYRYRSRAKKVGADKMNEELLALAASFQPTVFLFGKGETILPKTLASIKSQLPHCVVVFQSPDWYPDFSSHHARTVINLGQEADITLLAWGQGDELGARLHSRYREAGCKRTEFWHKGVDPEIIQPLNIEPEVDIVFLGAIFPGHPFGVGRLRTINALAEAGLNIRIYYGVAGDGLHKSIEVYPYVGSAYPLPAALGKINWDYREGLPYLCNSFDRIFPVMTSGLFYLTSKSSGMETLFEKGVHLEWYDSTEECVELALRYKDDDEARQRVGQAARERTIELRSADKMTAMLFQYINNFREEMHEID